MVDVLTGRQILDETCSLAQSSRITPTRACNQDYFLEKRPQIFFRVAQTGCDGVHGMVGGPFACSMRPKLRIMTRNRFFSRFVPAMGSLPADQVNILFLSFIRSCA
jgi:hypothetical protein